MDSPVRLAYQPPASGTFLSEQTIHQQSANSTFLSEQTSISHRPNEGRARYTVVPAAEAGFFLPTVGFLPLGSYRGIPLNTARIQISNQNR
jgi:hypothetical protein